MAVRRQMVNFIVFLLTYFVDTLCDLSVGLGHFSANTLLFPEINVFVS